MKSHQAPFLRLLFVLVAIVLSVCISPCSGIEAGETIFLTDLLSSMNHPPPGWSLSNISLACQWQNITCDLNGRIVEIALNSPSDSNATATLPPSLAYLDKLQTLIVHDVGLNQDLPSEFCSPNMTNLRSLRLEQVGLTGSILPCLSNQTLPNLNEISITTNYLTGTIPSSFATLPATYVALSDNSLSGPIPEEFSQNLYITTLQLNRNVLNGTIPAGLMDMPRLVTLDLSYNELVCPIEEFWARAVARSWSPAGCALNHNFFDFNIDHNTICTNVTTPWDTQCRILPPVEQYVEPAADLIPSFEVLEDGFKLAVFGAKWVVYPRYHNGTVEPREYLTMDFNSWLYQVTDGGDGPDALPDNTMIEQISIPPFHTLVANETLKMYTFITDLSNGAQMNTTVQFGTAYASAKFGLSIVNWSYPPFPFNTSYLNGAKVENVLYMQAAIRTPHSHSDDRLVCPHEIYQLVNGQIQCHGPLSNVSVFLQSTPSGDFGYAFSTSSELIQASFGFAGSYVADGQIQATYPLRPYSYLLPFGRLDYVSDYGFGNQPEQLDQQAVSLMGNFYFVLWNESLDWDPDLSILLNYDPTTPLSPESAATNAPSSVSIQVAAGVVVAVVVVAGVGVGLGVYIWRKRRYSAAQGKMRSALNEKHETSSAPSTPSKSKQTWKQSEKPLHNSLTNVQ